MSEQEQERNKPMADDPDVEAHRTKAYGDEGSEDTDPERKRKAMEEASDVEAHRFKS